MLWEPGRKFHACCALYSVCFTLAEILDLYCVFSSWEWDCLLQVQFFGWCSCSVFMLVLRLLLISNCIGALLISPERSRFMCLSLCFHKSKDMHYCEQPKRWEASYNLLTDGELLLGYFVCQTCKAQIRLLWELVHCTSVTHVSYVLFLPVLLLLRASF